MKFRAWYVPLISSLESPSRNSTALYLSESPSDRPLVSPDLRSGQRCPACLLFGGTRAQSFGIILSVQVGQQGTVSGSRSSNLHHYRYRREMNLQLRRAACSSSCPCQLEPLVSGPCRRQVLIHPTLCCCCGWTTFPFQQFLLWLYSCTNNPFFARCPSGAAVVTGYVSPAGTA